MGIEDFLVYYPNENQKKFNDIIYRKKEFYDNKLLPIEHEDKSEEEERDILKYQESNARFTTILANNDKKLVYHRMGLGKTTTAIETIELMYKQCEYLNMKPNKVLILLSNTNLIRKFKAEVFKRHPELYPIEEDTSENKKNKILGKKYIFDTYISFANSKLKKRKQFEQTVEMFSYTMVVCDEIHELTGLRSSSKTDVEVNNTYDLLHKFLHSIKSSKILLMSGTPMRDSVKEIASVMNLILDNDEQLPEKNFETEFFDENFKLKKNKAELLKNLFKNKISFLISPTNVPHQFITNATSSSSFNFLKLYYNRMSEFQSKNYLKIKQKESDGFRKEEQYATSFVFPDGSSGNEGFNKYVIKKNIQKTKRLKKDGTLKKYTESEFKLSDEFLSVLRPSKDTSINKRLKILQNYSSKFASAIKQMLDNPNDVCFWFSEFVNETGTILFSTILKDVFDFKPASGKSYSKNSANRTFTYALITSKTSNIHKYLNWSNSEDNVNAEVVKVIIGSKLLSTGYDLFNIKQVHIDTSHWNYPMIDQTISRALRFNGNNKLIEAGIDPTVSIYLHTAILDSKKMDNNTTTVDVDMYKVCEQKDYKIKQIDRIAKEVSFDCALNYDVNFIKNAENNSRECDYQKCEYSCFGIKSLDINEERDLIKDTYRLLYQQTMIDANSEIVKGDLSQNQIVDEHTIGDNIYLNTKVLYNIQNHTQLLTSRLGFKCFLNTDGGNTLYTSNDTQNLNVSSWYSNFPMLTIRNSIDDILKSDTVIEDHIDKTLKLINKSKSESDIQDILKTLPSWTYESLLKDIYKNVLIYLSENDIEWTRKNIIEKDSKYSKIIKSTSSQFSVYDNSLFLIELNNKIWRIKYNADDVKNIEWTLQTGTITDKIITTQDTKFRERAQSLKIDFFGKIKGRFLDSFKLIQSNVKRSVGQNITTIHKYVFIYFIVKFDIERKSNKIDDKFNKNEILSFLKKNKDVKEFNKKYSDSDLNSDNWNKNTSLNVIWWLQNTTERNIIAKEILKILKNKKLLIEI